MLLLVNIRIYCTHENLILPIQSSPIRVFDSQLNPQNRLWGHCGRLIRFSASGCTKLPPHATPVLHGARWENWMLLKFGGLR